MIENDWRTQNCPENYPHVYCDCPFGYSADTGATCEGEWNCTDIENITVEVMAYYDTNYDGSINLEDDVDYDHY